MSNILILGGCGFIGRHLIDMLKRQGNCAGVRVSDKKLPCMCNMSAAHEALFEDESFVEYIQSDLSRDSMVERTFSGRKFDVVVNLAAETQLGLDQAVYQQHIVDIAAKCAAAAAAAGAFFIHVSDAHVYKPSDKPATEESELEPWTPVAIAHAAAEKAIVAVPGLRYCIIRPSTVYGPGDIRGLMPRLVVGMVYKHKKEPMKMPYTEDVQLNTVHVRDVCSAIIEISENTDTTSGKIYNISAPNYTNLGDINKILEQVFGIKTGFLSAIMNKAIKSSPVEAADTINDQHMKPWLECLSKAHISDSILSPFIDPELLTSENLYIDGSKIQEVGEFMYRQNTLTVGLINEELDYMRKLNPPQFPQ